MMVQAQDDQLLLLIYLSIAMVIPCLVLLFDDGLIHNK
jgi:hypothetical protein